MLWKIQEILSLFDKDGNILVEDVEVSQDTFGIFAKVWEAVSSRGLEMFMDVSEHIDPYAEMIGSQENVKIKYRLEDENRGEIELRFIEVK